MRTNSIMLEDYEMMEKFMKEFILIAPSIQSHLQPKLAETPEVLDLIIRVQGLANRVQIHLES